MRSKTKNVSRMVGIFGHWIICFKCFDEVMAECEIIDH